MSDLPGSTSFIRILLDNVFTFATDYCVITTTATPDDDRGIKCHVWVTEDKVFISNLDAVTAGTSFQVDLEVMSVSTSGTVSPTVSITTYYDTDKPVDESVNVAFTPSSVTNTNL